MVLVGLSSYGQQVDDEFTSNNITYKVTILGSSNTVMITDTGNENRGNFTILENVTNWGIDFEVIVIRDGAIADNTLTSVIIPSSVTHIEKKAFMDSGHKEVIQKSLGREQKARGREEKSHSRYQDIDQKKFRPRKSL